MILITLGAVLALVGIVYTASLPASNPRVVGPLVAGFVTLLAFGLWETYGSAKRPLTPTRVFTRSKGRDFTAPAIALAIINMFYYSSEFHMQEYGMMLIISQAACKSRTFTHIA